MDMTKEKLIEDNFVDRRTAIETLDLCETNLPSVVSAFNIETKLVGAQKLYYNTKDIERAIKEVDEFHKTHYLGKYVYENIVSLDILKRRNINSVSIPAHYKHILRDKYNIKFSTIFYNKKEIDDLKTIIETENQEGIKIEGYLGRDEMIDIFEIVDKTYKMNKLVQGFGLATQKSKREIFYKEEDVKKAVEELKNFFENHYFSTEVKEMVSNKDIVNNGIEKVDIPKHYSGLLRKTYSGKSGRVAYKKDEIDKLVKKLDDINNALIESKQIESENKKKEENNKKLIESGKYVDSLEAIKILSFAPTNFKLLKTLRDANYLSAVVLKGKYYYYSVEDMKNIIKMREKFFKEYVPIGSYECNKYFEEYQTRFRAHSYKLEKYDVPLYCYGCTEKYGASYSGMGALKIADVKECLKKYEEREKSIIDKSISGETPFETFLIRLEGYAYWEGFKEESPYTKSKFVEYVQKDLSRKVSKKTIDGKIRRHINLGLAIKNMLDRYSTEEVYLLSDSQINLYLRTLEFKTLKCDLYSFLSSVNVDLKKLGLVSKLNFKFNNIINPRKEDVETLENQEKDLYDFEVYANVFNFLSKVENHIPKILDELKSNGSVVYASVWLYLILHMNNAWRNGDCNRFPELVIKDLIEEYGIDDIGWFENNNLTLAQSHGIIFRVRQWEMRMSKTQMNGVFFCSDELAPAFATAVIILHLYKYNYSTISQNIDSKLIMDFGNDDNDVSKSMINSFFKPANIKGFKFASKKFNKSIMTYIYFIANLSGDSKALVYAKEMRRHLNIDSTTHYVDFDINKVEAMSRQLFERGEFGYIPALLAQKVLGGEEIGSFDEVTNRIQTINAVFNDVQNINNTTKFLNIIRSERQNVIDMISEKSFSECQEILTDMFARNLPSKYGGDIQCLFSKTGCKMPNLDDKDECSCFDCPYHIPSIYALSKLCNSLVNNYKEYLGLPKNIKLKDFRSYLLESPDKSSTLNKKSKMQLGLKIERRKVLLIEAIKKYGAEYVYRCLDIDRDEFKLLSDFVKLDFYEKYPELL